MAEEISMQDIKLAFAEVAERFKETDKKFQETDKKIKEAMGLFTTQWGKLIESLVEGEIVRLFNEKGILVERISTRVKGRKNGNDYEFDIIAHNGTEIVIVEVKTTLRVKDVKKFLTKLDKVKEWIPAYANLKIYGALAYLKADEQSDTHAESKGLWVIRATGNSASISNKESFQPKIY